MDQRQENLLRLLKKDRDKKKGKWKDVGPKTPPVRRKNADGTCRQNQARTLKEDTESAVQREVALSARRLGICLWRQPAGKIFAGIHPIQLAPAGAADLTGVLSNGRRVEVECKRRYGGVQSVAQKEWQKFIEENNGIYILAHSGDEFQDKIAPILREML